ncbi:carboxypeptidase-like regulatory domain-containing protein [Mucilaginibacter terrenus]|uniref:Carboxypeptidase-like regulatory domain-containing protein n=1 Tax=Mucilaginibacter terrenus TaxID=2482727 RepID=A0A3E2NX23_9SPHI|nr:carboxypeptidase-like regulatory domain-containing protein [Mucilaginibacter terrenus]RFZ85499.1 carboxypeptidase-like regulatory domain-containing protein [Mucilaginibacter terrenus]
MKGFLTLLFLLPLVCLGQITISGKLVNATNNSPVADASVFLSNATVGGKSAADGTFILRNVRPGQYELVVTVVGYETHRQTVMAAAESIALADIKLTPKTNELKEVVVRPDPDRANNYRIFKEEFLGMSKLAKECKILNPDVVDLDFDKTTRKLTGSSSEFIEIENKALGYKIKYLLSTFVKDYKAGSLYFEGSALFEEMKGSEKQKKRWLKNRWIAFEGSSMHFLRSIVRNDVQATGFEALRLIRKLNPDYHGIGDKYIQTLINKPLPVTDYASLTDVKGIFALRYTDCLYLMYTKIRDNSPDNNPIQSLSMPNYLTSILTLTPPYTLFDSNGVILNPSSVGFEGNWGKSRVAEMLPVDYLPPAK